MFYAAAAAARYVKHSCITEATGKRVVRVFDVSTNRIQTMSPRLYTKLL